MKKHIHTVILATLTILIATTIGIFEPKRASAAQRCFVETNQCMDGRIAEFWEQNGGLAVFGYPIGPQEQTTVDGKTFTVQRFERNRLELHPENARPYDVLLGRLGADRLGQQGRDWFGFAKSGDTGGCRVFAETGHAVCGAVLKAWRSNGLQIDGKNTVSEAESLALFGMPLSGLMTETLSDGKQYQVQWFERARFELHPENVAPYDVLLGLLGSEDTAFRNKPAPTAVPQATAVPQPTAVPTPDTTSILGTAELNARRRSMPAGYWSTTQYGVQLAAGSITYIPNIRYTDASPGRKIVALSITVKNVRGRGDDDVYINPFRFTLIDLEGNSYSHMTATYSLDGWLDSASIYPGYSGGGQLAFEIPTKTAPGQLLFVHESYSTSPMVLELRTKPLR
jgi:hypothetical protein